MQFTSLRPFHDFFFIAEAGVNHEGSLDMALMMVEAAARAGAHAIKFQAYTADNLAHKHFAKSYWDTANESATSQHNLFSKYESFTFDEWKVVKKACRENSIQFWLSIFDVDLAVILAPLCDGLKIASGDITFYRLHHEILSHKKPTIFSLGASTEQEISALSPLMSNNNSCALFCRLIYPTTDQNANYCDYTQLASEYSFIKGVSDHCAEVNGESVLISYALGASVVEKHFSLDSNLRGNDHYHSITPSKLQLVLSQIHRMQVLYGSRQHDILTTQKASRIGARRSLFFTRTLDEGHIITPSDVVELRPVIGMTADQVYSVIGSTLLSTVQQGDPVYPALIK